MARVGSGDSFDIGLWTQGENPSAGNQSFSDFTDKGLNGNFKRLWRAIRLVLAYDGSLNSSVITGTSLNSNVADGTSIRKNGSNQLEVMYDASVDANRAISTNHIKNSAVTTDKIANDAVDSTKLKDDASVDANRAVTTNHIRDSAITTAKIADDAVTAAKLPHDNNRTKIILTFAFDATSAGTYAKVDGVQTTASAGIAMRKAGSVTGSTYCNSTGTVSVSTHLYGTYTFAAGDIFTVYIVSATSPYQYRLLKNGGSFISYYAQVTNPSFMTFDIEFDD